MDRDKPNDVELVLNGWPGVYLGNLSLDEVYKIFVGCMEKLGSTTLKTLSCFEPLSEHLNCKLGLYSARIMEVPPKLPTGITLETPVVNVATLAEARSDKRLIATSLLLTAERALVLWCAEYELTSIGHGEHHEVMRSSRFELVDRDKLSDMHHQRHIHKWDHDFCKILVNILDRLRHTARIDREKFNETVRDHLARLGTIENTTDAVLGRLLKWTGY